MVEQWRDILGYEGYYQVSDCGRVRSLDRVVLRGNGSMKLKGRIMRLSRNSSGYLHMALRKDGVEQTKQVHQLVAEAFIGPCPDGQQVRHGPGRMLDNSVSNLCYGTPRDQILDQERDGTDNSRRVRRSDGKEYRSLAEAARDSGCWATDICKVCNGKYKTAGGFGWKYID